MKKHRLIWFFALAFVLSWYPWIIALIFPFFMGKSLVALWWIYASVWLLLSIAIVMISGLEPKTASNDRVKAGRKLLVTASL